MLNCLFVAVIKLTLFYRGIGQTSCSYEHYLVHQTTHSVWRELGQTQIA